MYKVGDKIQVKKRFPKDFERISLDSENFERIRGKLGIIVAIDTHYCVAFDHIRDYYNEVINFWYDPKIFLKETPQ